MIHHSFPTCDNCGARHVSGDREECIEQLKIQVAELKREVHSIKKGGVCVDCGKPVDGYGLCYECPRPPGLNDD